MTTARDEAAQFDIEVESGTLDLYHGTVQPKGRTIKKFQTSRAIPMPKTKWAAYNTPGETVSALTEIDAVWVSTDPEIASGYSMPRWGAELADNEQGQVYDLKVQADSIAYVPYTEEQSVRSATRLNPDVIVLEDRKEVLVLNPDLIRIERVTDAEGEDITPENPKGPTSKDSVPISNKHARVVELMAKNRKKRSRQPFKQGRPKNTGKPKTPKLREPKARLPKIKIVGG